MKKNKGLLIIILILTLTFISLTNITSAENKEITLEFFYTSNCPLCDQTKPIINEIEEEYSSNLQVKRILVTNSSSYNYTYFNQTYGFRYVPAIVISNETNQILLNYTKINKNNIENTIETMLPEEIGSDPESNKTDTKPQPKEEELNTYLLLIVILVFPVIILAIILFNKKKHNN